MNIVIALLTWIYRNAPTVLEDDFGLRVPSFARNEPKTLPALDAFTVKGILTAAYKEIDAAVSRLSRTQELLEGGDLDTSRRDLKSLFNALLLLGGGTVPPERAIHRGKNSLASRVAAAGGLRVIRAALFLTPEDVFAFYIAILAQTGGNPMAIRNMSRDAVREDVLRSDRKRVVWEKPRSRNEQASDFGTHRLRSAPNLIEQLLRLNDPLVRLASVGNKDKLFLCMNSNGLATVPCYQGFHTMLDAFIARNRLPSFEFKQLRKTAGTLHEQVGNIFVAKKKLNHKNLRTTFAYTRTDSFTDQNDRLILQFQGELVRQATKTRQRKASSKPTKKKTASGFNTVFGFLCKDPYAGTAPNSTVGKPCPSFTSCSTCPGAVVPLDNPQIVARLFNARQALVELERVATLAGWLERFQQLYSPTLLILENDLLPKVAPEIAAMAKKIIVPPILPTFE